MPTTVACKTCGLVQRLAPLPAGAVAECDRCGSVVARWKSNSLERTAAFSLAALTFYVPANIYPILRMDWYGVYSESTVWDGCVTLFKSGQWPVAVIVFLASMLVPLCKLLGLFALVASTRFGFTPWRRGRTRLYRLIDLVGPWAMLDVFLVAVAVALVKFGQLATVLPGPGLFAFTALVVLTTLASVSFDPGLLWQEREDRQ